MLPEERLGSHSPGLLGVGEQEVDIGPQGRLAAQEADGFEHGRDRRAVVGRAGRTPSRVVVAHDGHRAVGALSGHPGDHIVEDHGLAAPVGGHYLLVDLDAEGAELGHQIFANPPVRFGAYRMGRKGEVGQVLGRAARRELVEGGRSGSVGGSTGGQRSQRPDRSQQARPEPAGGGSPIESGERQDSLRR